jgi:hypothetical protein
MKYKKMNFIDAYNYVITKRQCVTIKFGYYSLLQEYEKQIINEGIDRFIEGYKLWVEDAIKQSNSSIITEQGDIQNWECKLNTEQIQQGMDETIIYLNSFKSI